MSLCSSHGKSSGPSVKRSESLVTRKHRPLVEWTHMDLKSRGSKRSGRCIRNDYSTIRVREGNESANNQRSRGIRLTPGDKHT